MVNCDYGFDRLGVFLSWRSSPPFLTVITVHVLCTYVRTYVKYVCIRGTRVALNSGDEEDARLGGVSENRNARCNAIHADAPRSPETCLFFDALRGHERFFMATRYVTTAIVFECLPIKLSLCFTIKYIRIKRTSGNQKLIFVMLEIWAVIFFERKLHLRND